MGFHRCAILTVREFPASRIHILNSVFFRYTLPAYVYRFAS